MSEDMEWQPVRIAPVEMVIKLHNGEGIDPDTAKSNQGKIVRVRPTDLKPPCNAKCGYQVHPDDARKAWPDSLSWTRTYLCEHQILAD